MVGSLFLVVVKFMIILWVFTFFFWEFSRFVKLVRNERLGLE